jgi:hypothetical protein
MTPPRNRAPGFFRVQTDAHGRPIQPVAAAASIPKPKPPTEEPTMQISRTLTVPTHKLRALFDLPPWADEATISAAMKCAPAPDVIRASSKRTPPTVSAAASRPTAASPLSAPWLSLPTPDLMALIQAAPDAELRSMALSALGTAAQQQAVAEELGHRQFLGMHFSAAARAAGYEPPRVDLTSRAGAPLKGISG